MKLSFRIGRYYGKLILFIALLAVLLIILLFSRRLLPALHTVEKRNVRISVLKTANLSEPVDCFLFVAILSSPESFGRRKGIRNTWLSLPGNKIVHHRFVLGTLSLEDGALEGLVTENEKTNDLLLLEDLKDSYYSLTLKLLKTLKWAADNIHASFFMKADDDSFVRFDILIRDLSEKEHLGRIYWGFFRGNANVKTVGPWAEKNWVLCDQYLPYALGGGYVISMDLVIYVNSIAHMVQQYKSEDVSLGTWLAPVRLNRIHDVRFDTEYKSRGCNNLHIVSHKQTLTDMYNKYHQLKTKGVLCDKEQNFRLSFDYDWQSKPSKCCKRKKGIP